MVMVEKMTLAALEKMDNGKVGAMFRSHLGKVVEDIQERSGDHTVRTVTLKMSLVPVGDSGTVDDIKVSFSCNSNVPAVQTREYSMMPHGDRQLMFNDLSPDNVRQGTLDQDHKTRGA
jgi:hypothetical protein